MVLPTLQLYLWILSILTTTIQATELTCPTITKTTHHSNCPAPTQSFCPTPLCIIDSPIPVPCGCPSEMATSMSYTACPTKCAAGCATYFSPIIAACTPPPSPPTTVSTPITTLKTITTTFQQPSSCGTITVSEGPDCWTAGCGTTYSRCHTTITRDLACGCKSLPTVTSCLNTKMCDGGCITSWQTGYLPCPMTTPFAVPTGV